MHVLARVCASVCITQRLHVFACRKHAASLHRLFSVVSAAVVLTDSVNPSLRARESMDVLLGLGQGQDMREKEADRV